MAFDLLDLNVAFRALDLLKENDPVAVEPLSAFFLEDFLSLVAAGLVFVLRGELHDLSGLQTDQHSVPNSLYF